MGNVPSTKSLKGHSDMKRFLIALCVAGQLSACATSPTVQSLHDAQADCAAGKADRCDDARVWAQMASEEQAATGAAIVGTALLLGAVALDVYSATQPTYQSTTTCSSWGYSSSCTTKAW
jgi:hypothetical protein